MSQELDLLLKHHEEIVAEAERSIEPPLSSSRMLTSSLKRQPSCLASMSAFCLSRPLSKSSASAWSGSSRRRGCPTRKRQRGSRKAYMRKATESTTITARRWRKSSQTLSPLMQILVQMASWKALPLGTAGRLRDTTRWSGSLSGPQISRPVPLQTGAGLPVMFVQASMAI